MENGLKFFLAVDFAQDVMEKYFSFDKKEREKCERVQTKTTVECNINHDNDAKIGIKEKKLKMKTFSLCIISLQC